MAAFDVVARVTIRRPSDVVRRQFGDVAHHADTGVHRGVVFEVLRETSDLCVYRQTTRVGPLRLRQEFELPRQPDGPLVNHVTKGQFRGGTITFTIEPTSADTTGVEAHVRADLPVFQRPVAPLLRRTVSRALAQALEEDRHDLESATYG